MEDEQKATTIILENILLMKTFTKKTLAKSLGISRPTLDSRLAGKSNWKLLEVEEVNRLYKGKANIKYGKTYSLFKSRVDCT